MNVNQPGMTNSIVKGAEGLHDLFTSILLGAISTRRNRKDVLIPMCNMTMQNGHDTNFHILHPIDNVICRAKLIEVHHSNISLHLSLTEIFNSQISAGTYHAQRVTTSVQSCRNTLLL